MGRRSKRRQVSNKLFQKIIIVIFAVFLAFVLYQKTHTLLRQSEYFLIKEVLANSSSKDLKARLVKEFKGKNIFVVDVVKIHQRLRARYSHIEDLRIIKKFPDKILVVAKKRIPFAQVKYNKNILILDRKGTVISKSSTFDRSLPYIIGIDERRFALDLGARIRDNRLTAAVDVLEAFKNDARFLSLPVERIDVKNLSQIYVYLPRDLKVIVDKEDIKGKLTKLHLVVSQKQLDMDKISYIDLRFKEPTLGRK